MLPYGLIIADSRFTKRRNLQERIRMLIFNNSLSANPTKWSYTLKQFVCKSQQLVWVFDDFVGLALKVLIQSLAETLPNICDGDVLQKKSIIDLWQGLQRVHVWHAECSTRLFFCLGRFFTKAWKEHRFEFGSG